RSAQSSVHSVWLVFSRPKRIAYSQRVFARGVAHPLRIDQMLVLAVARNLHHLQGSVLVQLERSEIELMLLLERSGNLQLTGLRTRIAERFSQRRDSFPYRCPIDVAQLVGETSESHLHGVGLDLLVDRPQCRGVGLF